MLYLFFFFLLNLFWARLNTFDEIQWSVNFVYVTLFWGHTTCKGWRLYFFALWRLVTWQTFTQNFELKAFFFQLSNFFWSSDARKVDCLEEKFWHLSALVWQGGDFCKVFQEFLSRTRNDVLPEFLFIPCCTPFDFNLSVTTFYNLALS